MLGEEQTLAIGASAHIKTLDTDWSYRFDQTFIGPEDYSPDRVALCAGRIDACTGVEVISVSNGGLLSVMLTSPIAKCVERLPVDQSMGVPVLDFYRAARPLCPTVDQVSNLLNDKKMDSPCYMLNLFKYRSVWRVFAYGATASRHQYTLSSQLVWSARCKHPHWEEVAIFRYPSRNAFIEMLSRQSYQHAARVHRERGWADTQLFILSNPNENHQ